jgi:hypothetical protein
MKEKCICPIKNCSRKISALGLCNKHYSQMKRNGKVVERTRFDKQDIITDGNISYVVLRNFNGDESGRVMIDTFNIPLVRKHKWYLGSSGYAVSTSGRHIMLMHRLINNTPEGYLTDHINRNKLDNRKVNLRTCNESENMENRDMLATNTAKVKGVYFHKATGKWTAEKIYKGKRYYFGLYDTMDEAKQEYVKRVKRLKENL